MKEQEQREERLDEKRERPAEEIAEERRSGRDRRLQEVREHDEVEFHIPRD